MNISFFDEIHVHLCYFLCQIFIQKKITVCRLISRNIYCPKSNSNISREKIDRKNIKGQHSVYVLKWSFCRAISTKSHHKIPQHKQIWISILNYDKWRTFRAIVDFRCTIKEKDSPTIKSLKYRKSVYIRAFFKLYHRLFDNQLTWWLAWKRCLVMPTQTEKST